MFSFKNLFKPKVRQPLPAGHVIETPPEIGCIAKQILNDLDIKKVDKWKLERKDGHKKVSCEGKKYILYISGGFVSLVDINEFRFTNDERKAISEKFDQLQQFIWERERQRKLKEDEEKLKKLFPDCYK